jgi:hypothetical protein
METLKERQINEIRNIAKKLNHRTICEQASFIRSYLKLKITEAEIAMVITPQENP